MATISHEISHKILAVNNIEIAKGSPEPFYLKENDISRAKKVCEIGLKFDSTNIEGIYMLAKIHILSDHITKAEKLLKINFHNNLFSIKTLKLLVEIRDTLNRSSKETKKIIDQLLQIEADDSFAHEWIHNYENNEGYDHNISPKGDITFNISNDIDTWIYYRCSSRTKNWSILR